MIGDVFAVLGAILTSVLTYLLTNHMANEERREEEAARSRRDIEIVLRELVRVTRTLTPEPLKLPDGW
jgi:hypothetical protein